jgi:hypothetical protein
MKRPVFLYSVMRLFCAVETQCVYCEVGTVIYINFTLHCVSMHGHPDSLNKAKESEQRKDQNN